MLVQDRERVRYNDDYRDYDYDYNSRNRSFARYDYESAYEEERSRTSDIYRDSLMSSLERPAEHSRLERSDDRRYGFYRSNIDVAENNYDKFWDNRRAGQSAVREEAPKRGRRKAMIVAYMILAVVAVLAVTLSIVGLGGKKVMTTNEQLMMEPRSASAEEIETTEIPVVATESVKETEVPVASSNEKYIVLKSGEKVAIEIPEQQQHTEEEEKGFDKFCSWLNGVFGG